MTGESKLSRGGGEPDFEGAVGGDVPEVEDPLLDPCSLEEGVVERAGRCSWECEAWLVVGESGGALST